MGYTKHVLISRRNVLKVGALAAGALAIGVSPYRLAEAANNQDASKYPDQIGFLYNQQLCIGCESCAKACKAANVWEEGTQWRRVLQIKDQYKYLSISCNHCENPACLTVCPVNAYSKRKEDGIVIHNASKCVGCKYCMTACPYHAPQFSEATGRISKCHFCYERQAQGEKPACAANCPTKALTFGKLTDLRKTVGGTSQLEGLPSQNLTGPSLVIIPAGKEG